MSFSDQTLSVVHPSRRRCHHRHCPKVFTFSSFSGPTRPISTKLGTRHPLVKVDSSLFKFPRGDNYENTLTNLKIFSRTTGPISTKLGINYLWIKGIQVCSNEGLLFSSPELKAQVSFSYRLLLSSVHPSVHPSVCL